MELLSLIIPCYNEADRFHLLIQGLLEFDKKWASPYELVLVNDGSSDSTGNLIDTLDTSGFQHMKSFQKVLLPKNVGKGFALRAGMMTARGDFLLTLDADMAAKPAELIRWREAFDGELYSPKRIVIASRRHDDSQIDAKPLRRILGNLLNHVVRLLTSLKIKDTQCGFKLYPRVVGQRLFGELREPGWAHDIEIILRAKQEGIEVISMPIEWTHVNNEKINVFLDGVQMVFSALSISRNLKQEQNKVKAKEALLENGP